MFLLINHRFLFRHRSKFALDEDKSWHGKYDEDQEVNNKLQLKPSGIIEASKQTLASKENGEGATASQDFVSRDHKLDYFSDINLFEVSNSGSNYSIDDNWDRRECNVVVGGAERKNAGVLTKSAKSITDRLDDSPFPDNSLPKRNIDDLSLVEVFQNDSLGSDKFYLNDSFNYETSTSSPASKLARSASSYKREKPHRSSVNGAAQRECKAPDSDRRRKEFCRESTPVFSFHEDGDGDLSSGTGRDRSSRVLDMGVGGLVQPVHKNISESFDSDCGVEDSGYLSDSIVDDSVAMYSRMKPGFDAGIVQSMYLFGTRLFPP